MNIFISVVGAILYIVAIFLGYSWKAYNIKEGNDKAKFPALGVVVAFIGFVAFIYGNSFVIIPTGYTGVRTTFGQIDERTVQNGYNWKIPFIQSVEKVNNKQQDIAYDGQIWSETSERTAIYYDGITVTYQINPERSAWIYANVSNYKDNLVTQSLVASAVKTSSKRLSSTDATNRGLIEPLVAENLQSSLDEKYGESVIIVNKVVIANTDFEDSYNQAIADKQTAQLAYEKQAIENQRAIEAAEAEAKVKTTQAQGEADAAVIRAQGEAEANRLLSDSLTDEILREMYLDKWDGALPKVSLSGDTGTIVDIGNVIDDVE